jgi:hypothetical protein
MGFSLRVPLCQVGDLTYPNLRWFSATFATSALKKIRGSMGRLCSPTCHKESGSDNHARDARKSAA